MLLLGMESAQASPIIFEHKVANVFGSFPQIYNKGYLFNEGINAVYSKLKPENCYGSLFAIPPFSDNIIRFFNP